VACIALVLVFYLAGHFARAIKKSAQHTIFTFLVAEGTRETISKEGRLLIVAWGSIEGIHSRVKTIAHYEIRRTAEADEITTVRVFSIYCL